MYARVHMCTYVYVYVYVREGDYIEAINCDKNKQNTPKINNPATTDLTYHATRPLRRITISYRSFSYTVNSLKVLATEKNDCPNSCVT